MTSFRSICTAAALTVFVMGFSTQGFASTTDHPAAPTNHSVSSIKLAAIDSYMVFIDYDDDYLDSEW